MAQVNFPILNVKDQDLQLIQANIQQTLAQIQQSPFLGGTYQTGIVLIAGTPKVINHGLNRQPVIWALGDNIANSIVWRSDWNSTTITLNASANTTIAVWTN